MRALAITLAVLMATAAVAGVVYVHEGRVLTMDGLVFQTEAAPAAPVSLPDPVARWKFNNDVITNLTPDASGQNLYGTFSGSTDFQPAWYSDSATEATVGSYEFDPGKAQLIAAPTIADLNFTTSFSIGCFLKTTQSSGDNMANVAGKGLIESAPTYNLYLSASTSYDPLFLAKDAANNTIYVVGPSVNNGAWHHLGGSMDHATGIMSLYVDGLFIGSDTNSLADYTNSLTFACGGRTAGVKQYDGYVDDVSVWAGVVSSQAWYDIVSTGSQPTNALEIRWDYTQDVFRAWSDVATMMGADVHYGTATHPFWTNSAWQCDGVDDYLSVTDPLRVTNHYTISVWLNALDTDNETTVFPLSIANGAVLNLALRAGGSATGITQSNSIALYDAVSGGAGGSVANTYTDAGDTGVWRHVVATYDGSLGSSRVALYKDGAALSMATNSLAAGIGTHDRMNVGRGTDGNWQYYGSIDDVQVFNEVLSAAQVELLYNNGRSQ